jgi:hypothetical protein
VKAEKGSVEAAAGAATATRSGSGNTPFANEGGAAAADDGRRRYTPDFMKTLREANRTHPGDLKPGEWEGNPPAEMPAVVGYGQQFAGSGGGNLGRK